MGVMANRKESNRIYCYRMAELACEALFENDKRRAILFAKGNQNRFFNAHIQDNLSLKGMDAYHNDNFRREVIEHARDYMRVLIYKHRRNL